MGMTIEEAIQILEQHHMWTGEPQEIIDVRVENSALGNAIDTMRKYQKIQEIVNSWRENGLDYDSCDAMDNIERVVEDGNDD